MQKILTALVERSMKLEVRQSVDRDDVWYAELTPAVHPDITPAPGSVEGCGDSPEEALAVLELLL